MFEPQDLPGRYGRVIAALDHVLAAIEGQAVLGGGWAVWRHGFFGRMTQDVDIVLPAQAIGDFLQVASVSGFEVLDPPAGRWPKLRHRGSDVMVDICRKALGLERPPGPLRRPSRIRQRSEGRRELCATSRCKD